MYVYGFNVEFMYYFCGNFYTLSFLGKIFEKKIIFLFNMDTICDSKDIYRIQCYKVFIFQTNVVLLNFLLIK